MRKKLVVGNWKMFTTASTARQLAAAVVAGLGSETRLGVVVCPPFPYLAAVAEVIQGSPVALGAQNLYFEKDGAFTGEVSAGMLLDVGCTYVLVGHSERRHVLGESDAIISRKVHAALDAGLHVILCVGETLQDRQSSQAEIVFQRQGYAALAGLLGPTLERLVVAYEPVWAIGTGQNATPDQAQQAHAYIRERLSKFLGESVGAALPILYGGSVKPENAAALLSQPDVDGVLVGGASLKADQFLAIARAAAA